MNPEIRFLKWKDPTQVHEEDFDEDVVDQEVKDLLEVHRKRPFQPGAFHFGPGGFIPVAPQNCASEQYNLWVFHTNFNLGDQAIELMKRVPGVEILRIWTRYRGWLGVGKLFDTEQVHQGIRAALGSMFTKGPTKAEMLAASATAPAWAVVTSPAGEWRLIEGRTPPEVTEQMLPCEVVDKASWVSY